MVSLALQRAPRMKPTCPHCGSESVGADAAARWDDEHQLWDVSNVYDKGGWCDDCEAHDITFKWVKEKK